MTFLKALINSLVSGFFSGFLFALLTLDLNINLPFRLSLLGHLSLSMALVYGLIISALCLGSFFIIQFFAGRSIKIAIVSPSFLVLSFSSVLILFLVIFKANQDFYLSFFDAHTLGLLRRQWTAFIIASGLGAAAFIGSRKYKQITVIFPLYFFVLGLCLFFALNARAGFPVPQAPEKGGILEVKKIDKQITIIGIGGLSFDFLIPLINEEKLPNFSVLLEEGSWGKLASLSPNEPAVLNTSFNTGKLPFRHRRLSSYQYFLKNVPHPIEVVPRYIFFRQLVQTGLLRIQPFAAPSMAKDIWKIFEDNQARLLKRDRPHGEPIEPSSPKAEVLFNRLYEDLRFETGPLMAIVRKALDADVSFEERFALERGQNQPQLSYLLLEGLSDVQSFFYKFSFPDIYGNIDQEEINKYSGVIERYYQFYDQLIGRYLAAMKMNELLVIYSPYGIEALPLWKRLVEWMLGNPDLSAYHDNAPEGVIFFYGTDIVRGQTIEGMRLIDVAPTLLNYLGLPVGRDMDGIVHSAVFVPSFKFENPVLYISSYEEIDIKPPGP